MTDIEKIAQSLRRSIEKSGNSTASIQELERTLTKWGKKELVLPVLRKLQFYFESQRSSNQIRIEAPFVLSQESLDNIAIKITGTNDTEITQIHKSELLAGFRAVHKGTLYDASAQRYINELKKL
jgi:F0F1-type ATP synthase delta subunit